MYTIYKITNTVNNKIYIGITSKTVEERFNGHLRCSKNPKYRLHQAIEKHGKDKFKIEIIETVDTQESANEREMHWIKQFNCTEYTIGYNMTNGGQGSSMIFSESRLEKMSDSVKLQRKSLTVEQRKAMTLAANLKKKGYKESEISSMKKSIAQKQRWDNTSAEEKEKIAQKIHDNKSDESKERTIDALKSCFNPAKQKGFEHKQTQCPHCGKFGGSNAMNRYHFNKCKSKL